MSEAITEAKRQVQICNACRYCEGFCAVFPEMHAARAFSDGDVSHLANLCHNCRGCYYACQYTEPHEFALNLPKALAEVRQESWIENAWPSGLARLFHRNGFAMVAVLVVSFALLFGAATTLRPESGNGFYAVMSHGMMVAIFTPAFLLPLAALGVSLRRYWGSIGGGRITMVSLRKGLAAAATMRNLRGGHGEGCNFEDGDRFTLARAHAHQAMMWGFLLCFAATSTGTIFHYGFGWEAPYPLLSLPKLFGVSGGLLMVAGGVGLAALKRKADPALAADEGRGAAAFVWLLVAVAATGLVLYAATGTAVVGWLLPLHLGTVLTLFLLTPYTKMAHGAYRLLALMRD